MTFRVEKITLRGFRNHQELEVDLASGVTIIVGPNAVGKTNVIEALELLSAGTSFRRLASWDEIVTVGQTTATASIRACDECGERTVTLVVPAGGRRRYTVNGKPVQRVSDVAGSIPAVVFTPDDLGLVKGPASARRKALDDLGRQASAAYAAVLDDFERILKHRNALLRDDPVDEATFEVVTNQFVDEAAQLVQYRLRLFERLAEQCSRIHPGIANGEPLELRYDPSAPGDGDYRERLRDTLRRSSSEERSRRTTVHGPHRDDVSFFVSGREARAYASQGQQRTVALSWKLAEVAVIERIAGRRPLLLLDDVMSELDDERRAALTKAVEGAAQAVITTTNLAYFSEELVSRAKVVQL